MRAAPAVWRIAASGDDCARFLGALNRRDDDTFRAGIQCELDRPGLAIRDTDQDRRGACRCDGPHLRDGRLGTMRGVLLVDDQRIESLQSENLAGHGTAREEPGTDAATAREERTLQMISAEHQSSPRGRFACHGWAHLYSSQNSDQNDSLRPTVAAGPSEVSDVRVGGHRLRVYRYGPPISARSEVVLLVNGGPGLPSEYLRAPHARLAALGFTVIAYDQLGCGASDRPTDASLWTLGRYVEELAQLCVTLRLPPVQLLGHSWGTWLGTEFCLLFPRHVKSYVAADGAVDVPHLVSELHRLRAALGMETVAMMIRREAQGTTDHRHVCRCEKWPEPLQRSLADWNMGPYITMQGPNEFTYTGNMRQWNRIPS